MLSRLQRRLIDCFMNEPRRYQTYTIRQLVLMPKSWNELLRHWRSGCYIVVLSGWVCLGTAVRLREWRAFVVRLDERFESTPVTLSDSPTSGILSLPKPKLAPIASCETLTDSYDINTALSGTESSSLGSSPAELVSDDASTSSTLITSSSQQQQQHRSTTTTANSRRPHLPTTTMDSLCVSSTDELSTATSSDTLVPGSPGHCTVNSDDMPPTTIATTPTQSSSALKRSLAALLLVNFRGGGDGGPRKSRASSSSPVPSHQLNALALSPATSPKFSQSPLSALRRLTSPPSTCDASLSGPATTRRATSPSPLHRSPVCSPKLQRASSPISYSYSSPNIITNMPKSRAACTSLAEF